MTVDDAATKAIGQRTRAASLQRAMVEFQEDQMKKNVDMFNRAVDTAKQLQK